MAKISNEMMNMLTMFLIKDIKSKAMDGITYVLLTKEKSDEESVNNYMNIANEVRKCGYGRDEIFRVYEVSNGYIFDMDIEIAKKITINLAKAVEKTNGVANGNGDIIGESPEKRRKNDMVALAKYVTEEYNKGEREIEVALFSRNTVPNIVITGRAQDGKQYAVKYNAYAIRHWDIELINSKLLIPNGIRIAKIEPKEVLQSKTGVLFTLYLE